MNRVTLLEARPIWSSLDADQRSVARRGWEKLDTKAVANLARAAEAIEQHPLDLFIALVVAADPRVGDSEATS